MISKHMAPYMEGNKTVRAMFELGKNLAAEIGAENVYDFSLGNPNVNPPEAVKQAIIDILNTEDPHVVHGYMSNAGFDLTRQAIADNLNQRFGGEGAHYAAKNIVMETGAAYALNVVLRTILDDEDEIITFAPYFLEYANYVRNYNGKTVAVPQSPETGFQPNLDAFEKMITPRTKGVIINNPNNPTGVIYTEETMTKLAAILKKKEEEFGTVIYLISDEPYRELVYTDVKVPFAPKFYDDTIVAYSFSKSLSLPGERIGYLAVGDEADGAEELLAALAVTTRVLGTVNAPSLIQLAVARCLNEKVDVDYYKKNAEDLYRIVTEAGFEAVKPQGAFYLWVKAPDGDDNAFVNAGIDCHIIMAGGSGFAGPGYVRLAFCVDHEMILKSEPAFRELAVKYF